MKHHVIRMIYYTALAIVWVVCVGLGVKECKVTPQNVVEQELQYDDVYEHYYVMNGNDRFVVDFFSYPRVGNSSEKTRQTFVGKDVVTFYWKGKFKVYPKEEMKDLYFNLKTCACGLIFGLGCGATFFILLFYALYSVYGYNKIKEKLRFEKIINES